MDFISSVLQNASAILCTANQNTFHMLTSYEQIQYMSTLIRQVHFKVNGLQSLSVYYLCRKTNEKICSHVHIVQVQYTYMFTHYC